MFRQNLLCLSLCPLLFILSLSTNWEDPGFIIFAPSLEVFIYIDQIPSETFSRLTSPSSLSPSSWERFSSPFKTFMCLCWTLQHVHIFFVLRNVELDTGLPVWLHQVKEDTEDLSLLHDLCHPCPPTETLYFPKTSFPFQHSWVMSETTPPKIQLQVGFAFPNSIPACSDNVSIFWLLWSCCHLCMVPFFAPV